MEDNNLQWRLFKFIQGWTGSYSNNDVGQIWDEQFRQKHQAQGIFSPKKFSNKMVENFTFYKEWILWC